jgi:hypothetical protein
MDDLQIKSTVEKNVHMNMAVPASPAKILCGKPRVEEITVRLIFAEA